jgi:CrcB protein
MTYLWVMIGSALGGGLRYALTRMTLNIDRLGFPFGTVAINVLGSFVIGYFGTLTLQTGKYAASDQLRAFVMIGICGGFTTFSSFSLQTFDLMRTGLWVRAFSNIVLSIVLCIAAVAAGHLLARQSVDRAAIAQSADEEYSG